MYKISHKKPDGSFVNEEARELHEKLQNEMQNCLENEAFQRVCGKKHPGYVRGMGLGVRPSQIIGSSRATSSSTSYKSNEKIEQLQAEVESLKAQVAEVDVLKQQIAFLMQRVKGNEELNKIKKQVDNVEATKANAISELESAKEILQNLITKLANVSQCKQSTTAAAQVERNRSRGFEKIDIAEEKNSLKTLMFCLRKYLNQVQKEQGEVKEKKHAAEAIAANLTIELQNSREESRPEPFTAEELEANIF
ncbi:hypothetical protein Fmac_005669 [Flemingia macrophylla]|uniref:Uncharacterized protein n=1 Tax=Flemingia macrophylla TaxID=520843 RepID=A0ABD1N8J5_9FABA